MVVKQLLATDPTIRSLRVVLSHMVVKHPRPFVTGYNGLRVVLSHMVVKQMISKTEISFSLRVVLSHMVVKLPERLDHYRGGLRVVLSHMVVKLFRPGQSPARWFESSVISYGSQTGIP